MILGNSVFYVLGYVAAWGILILLALLVLRLAKRCEDKKGLCKIIGNFGAGLIGIIAFILIMEAFFGFFYDQTDSFGVTITSRRWLNRHYRNNNLEFRDDKDYYLKKANGKRRIVFIGDSYTAGHGVKDIKDRFSNRVEDRLARKVGSGYYEIYTIAIGGWDTIDEIDYLSGLVENGFETDIVVLCFNMNDIGFASINGNINLQKIRAQAPTNWLLQNSFFLNFLYARLKLFSMPEVKGYFDWLDSSYADAETWLHEKKMLEDFIELCRNNNYKLKVAIFPLIGDLTRDFKMKDAHKKVSDFFKSRGVPCIDLADKLKEFPEKRVVVNRFDAHPNEFAHSVIADEIWTKFVEKELRAN